MKPSLSLVLMLVSTFYFASCSKIEDMSDNAVKASENSGRAADAAQESREEIAVGRMMSRSASASDSRRKALKAIPEQISFENKVTEASKYVKAFEFQVWTGQRYDSLAFLKQLYEDAMNEFFRGLVELNSGNELAQTGQSPFRLRSGSKNRDLNIFAVAVALHGEHILQEHVIAAKEEKSELISMYDLLKKALRSVQKVEMGEMYFQDLEEYEKVVYEYREQALDLLQARITMLLTMNLVKVSEIKNSKMEAILLKTPFKRSFYSQYPNKNLAQKYKLNEYLDAALKVKDFLQEIGIEPVIISDLRNYYGKMRFPHIKENQTEEEMDLLAEHKRLISEFF
ncbi:MAG: hypothetical protein CME62_15695 [Halobacteriovoraceae bacterium]|nr:hypothetical protein [Halobacteriovoraceae bacterium]|tara:strand:+ start:8263 stop:9285 length:1023 start_codon:yes stop_codon:yes gene_type:complete